MTVLLLLPLPLFVWAAVRFGTGGVSVAMLGFAFMVIWSVAHGHGPFIATPALEAALPIQLFLTLLAAPMLLLAALVQERRLMESTLAERESQYRSIVDSTGDGVLVTDLSPQRRGGESRLLHDLRLQRRAAAQPSSARLSAPRRSAAVRLPTWRGPRPPTLSRRASCASARTGA